MIVPTANYPTSRDYRQLWELAHTAAVVCIVDMDHGKPDTCRDIARTVHSLEWSPELVQVGSRGIGHVWAESLEAFIAGCEQCNLEWLVPPAALAQPEPGEGPSAADLLPVEPPSIQTTMATQHPKSYANSLKKQLLKAMKGRTHREIADSLLVGTFHSAVAIDYATVPAPAPAAGYLEADFRAWYKEAYGSSYYGAIALCDAIRWAEHLFQRQAAPAPAVVPVAARRGWDDGFMAGVCVALATVTLHYDSVIWKEIVQSVGIDSLLNYAANVNPEDWDLAGFSKYAQAELGKDRPDPQGAAPWTDGPAVQNREPASVAPETNPTPADRLALVVCRGACPTGGPCPVEAICSDCRRDSAAVAHELAAILRERHGGSSQVADWLDGVGCHAPGAGQTVQEGS
jgi:hypothetical protein